MSNNYNIIAFAYSDKCETTLQKMILMTLSGCPDPAGGDWTVTSIPYLADFCVAPMTDIKKELGRLCELGAIHRIEPPKGSDVEPGDICFVGGR